MMPATLVVLVAYLSRLPSWETPAGETGSRLVAEAGLSAEVLAAAGCSAENATAIAEDILGNTEGRAARTNALASLASVDQQLANAAARLSTNPHDEQAFRDKVALRLTRAEALQSVVDAEHGLRVHCGSLLSQGAAALLESGALSRGHVIPPAARVGMPSDTNWRNLAIALRAQNRATRMGEEVPAECQTMLQAVSSNSAVSAAAEHFAANIAAVRTALHTTFEP